MSLIARLDDARRRRNILEHPFYTRWEHGELTRDELSVYAGEYRHAVVALSAAAEAAAPLAGTEHAEEERKHVALWDEFAAALDSDLDRRPHPETRRCAAAWTSAEDPLEGLAILYAIEAGQPEVSRTKLTGLVEHYGFDEIGEGTSYFRLHAELDREHAAHSRELLERFATPRDEDRLVAAAERALDGNWALLDGVSS
jgi:pyrroloquinoline quinone (PQQ) biosynthesis protein C